MKALKAYSKVLDMIEKVIRVIEIILLAAMTLIIFYQCIMRYVFSSSQPWCEELTLILSIYSVLIGIAICSRRESHLQVDFVLNFMSKKIRCLMTALCTLASIVVMVLVCLYAIQLLPFATAKSITLPITIKEVYMAFPLGAVLTILFAFETAAKNFLGFLNNGEIPNLKEENA